VHTQREPAQALRGSISSYYGFREETGTPVVRREGPGADVVVILAFEEGWLIDGERFKSFAAGLRDTQVTTEHAGLSYGMQVNIAPPAAHALFGIPLSELAFATVDLDAVLAEPALVERVACAGNWSERFEILDEVLTRRIAVSRPPSREIVWAWRRLVESHGTVPVGELGRELGWTRKRLVARFREQVGVPPKTLARMLRFERAQSLAGRHGWAELAAECGYYDQSHLIREFRSITGRTPETFLQDTVQEAA
jgi:AraC-like DNA-binding protein